MSRNKGRGSGSATQRFVEALEERVLMAAVLVKDLNPTPVGSVGVPLLEWNDILYFSLFTSSTGTELWRSDGTSEGTFLLKDINPGNASSSPRSLTEYNGQIYFTATTAANGSELWRTDGTSDGTVLFKDINPGTVSSAPTKFIPFHNKLFFAARGAGVGLDWFSTDGTVDGTSLFMDLNPGQGDGVYPTGVFPGTQGNSAIVLDGVLYFEGNNGTSGTELFGTDGTTAGTRLVIDARPGSASSTLDWLTPLGDDLYFTSSDSAGIARLWRMQSDGTTAAVTGNGVET